MVTIGNFFFRHRNWLFIFLYAVLFIPSPSLFTEKQSGPGFYRWPLLIGLLVTISGTLVRAATIGLAYIIRGGKEGKPYAEGLVTGGIFHHCRNPLYIGNILMLLGMGLVANSLYFIAIAMPLFLFIYQSVVLAEEYYLRGKFGVEYIDYCRSVNRWLPRFKGLGHTFSGIRFNWRRWVLKEYNTLFIWLEGLMLMLLFRYPQLTGGEIRLRNILLAVILPLPLLGYLFIRHLKKSGKMVE